ncbi:hypothetical protein SAMN05421827_1414 [Pedobacter terrae]|uniref:Uncharacterized protein n=1 Tax=Pedobacter terrae TaxID=405671 RepID=A0A1G8ELB4_9SPHI|nr:hypothetical protein SAMN05421827_1414 [Pedobacter terrae]
MRVKKLAYQIDYFNDYAQQNLNKLLNFDFYRVVLENMFLKKLL